MTFNDVSRLAILQKLFLILNIDREPVIHSRRYNLGINFTVEQYRVSSFPLAKILPPYIHCLIFLPLTSVNSPKSIIMKSMKHQIPSPPMVRTCAHPVPILPA